ncbi:MAG: 30S ribosomal protein S18 [Lentisphaerae bacterium]|nr:30S ribosomal protein S18 [Lentisphaerota bacterium]
MAFKRNTEKRNDKNDRNDPAGGPRKRARYLDPNTIVDRDDTDFLRRFVTEHGKIIPARITGVTAMQQREIKRGVRRARTMGLLA